MGREPPSPPSMEMPAGCNIEVTLEAGHAVALPGMPLPMELATFQAPEPTGGKFAVVQPAWIVAVVCANWPRFWPAMATLASGEISPNTGARNDVPQAPLMVRSSMGDQLKATLGLEVPKTSLYWSWRHETS